MTLANLINGFYDYIKSENIKGAHAVASVYLYDYTDSSTYVEIELYPIGAAYLKGDASTFYGYVMRDSFYCFFCNNYKYLERDTTIVNPDIIKRPVIKLTKTNPKQKIPKPSYHPYKWEIIFKNDLLLEIHPKTTVEKFIKL